MELPPHSLFVIVTDSPSGEIMMTRSAMCDPQLGSLVMKGLRVSGICQNIVLVVGSVNRLSDCCTVEWSISMMK